MLICLRKVASISGFGTLFTSAIRLIDLCSSLLPTKVVWVTLVVLGLVSSLVWFRVFQITVLSFHS